jgi:hypothetical protein
MGEHPNTAWTTTVNAWHKLWSRGANRANTSSTIDTQNTHSIHNNNRHNTHINNTPSNQQQRRKTKKKNNSSNRLHSTHNNSSRHPSTINTTSATAAHEGRESTQRDLHGNAQELNDVEAYGDTMRKKSNHTLRIMLHNINRLPIDGRSAKSRKLLSTIATKQIDIALLTEVGLYWKKINSRDRWYE